MFNSAIYSYEKFDFWLRLTPADLLKFLGYLTFFLIIFVLIPSAFGISLGFFKIYKNALSVIFMNAKNKNNFGDKDKTQEDSKNNLTFNTPKRFEILDVCKFSNAAAKAIVEDTVLKRFTSEELPDWNFMSRSYLSSYSVGGPYVAFWLLGTFYRYFIQLPCRLILIFLTLLYLTIGVYILNYIPGRLQNMFVHRFNVIFCRMSICSLGVFAEFHDLHNMPTRGIVVANHTTPIDVLVLGSKSFYRFIGQIQPGLFAYLQNQLSNMGHIFFERRETSDRSSVVSCIKQHAIDPSLPPVIIFPEGTCINNTSVMQFCKGTFEVCDTVHPVAIKYNPMFGDAFWNSSKESYGWYMINMASSWFVYCDVWFLPPLTKLPNEDAVSFAGRVQKAIAEKANIINLDWNGNLKRSFVPSYMKLKKQKEYANSLMIKSIKIRSV